MSSVALPKKLHLHQRSKTLDLLYEDQCFTLTAEFLRVHSPSAEVRGHGNPQLQTGKQNVGIQRISQIGTYAIQIHFDDGHRTGLYTWAYLRHLCENQNQLWQTYLEMLANAGAFRDPAVQVVKLG